MEGYHVADGRCPERGGWHCPPLREDGSWQTVALGKSFATVMDGDRIAVLRGSPSWVSGDARGLWGEQLQCHCRPPSARAWPLKRPSLVVPRVT